MTASDEAILEAMRLAGRHGVFAEPAAAAAAGRRRRRRSNRKRLGRNDRVLVMITGSGLKDTQKRHPRRRPADRNRTERRRRVEQIIRINHEDTESTENDKHPQKTNTIH